MAQEVRNIRSSVRVGFLTLSVVSGTSAITFDGSGTATVSKSALFYEPFDNLTAWTLGSGGTATITAGGQVGNFVRNSGGASRGHALAAGDQSTDFDVSFWWRCSNVGTALVTVISISSSATVNSPQELVVTVPTDKSWRVQNGSLTYGSSATNAVAVNVWYRVRLVAHMATAASGGTVRLDIDGVTVVSDATRPTYQTTPNIASIWTSGINGLTEDYDELILETGGGAPVTTGTGAITFAGSGVATSAAGGVSTSGTGAITFAGSGTATLTYSTSGTGAITFAGSGVASSTGFVAATGTGAITFAGSGTATLSYRPTGTGAITFAGSGTATAAGGALTGTGAISFAGRAAADVAPRLDVYAPPEWSWLVLQPDGTPIGPLTVASARRLTFQLDGSASVSFTMPGDHPQTATIYELATDVYVARNGRPLFRGRIGGSSETHAASTDSVNFAATDYRGLLDHRLVWPESTLEYVGVDEADIAWQLIAESQALGDLGISRGIGGVTGVARDRKFTPGTSIGQAVKDLGGVAGGFDWEIDAYLAFNLYHPQRGRDVEDQVLVYGRDVVAVTTTVDPSKYANAVFFTGSTADTFPAERIATPPGDVGRWERQLADPNATLQTTVDEEAAAKLADASQLISAITATLAADVWNPYLLWLGDSVRVLVQAGRLDLDVTRRIVQIDVTLDDTGVETVTLNIGSAPPKLSDRLNSLQQQLTQLQIQPDGGGGGDGTGGPGGGIQEITSLDESVTIVHPRGPVTDLSVFGTGRIIVTNPTGPVVDLSYASQSETVHNTYDAVSLLASLAFFESYGMFSFASGPDSPASWLVSRPNESLDGGVNLINNGEPVSQIIGAGYYDLTVDVATTQVPMGVNVDGDVIVFPISVLFENFPPFGIPYVPATGGGPDVVEDGFICGVDGPKTLKWGRTLVTDGMLASGDLWAAFTILADAGPSEFYGHLTSGGAISMTLNLTRIW